MKMKQAEMVEISAETVLEDARARKWITGISDDLKAKPNRTKDPNVTIELESTSKVTTTVATTSSDTRQPETEARTSLTRDQYFLMMALGNGYFCLGASYSLLAPFFPKEAELKGATPSQYGVIFSIYEVVAFLLCPVFGKMMPHLMPKHLVILGLLVAGYCYALFGILCWSPPGATFVGLALAIRTCSGVGGAAFFTAAYTCVAIGFPQAVAKAFATVEMALGLGMIAGPAIGGLLYEVGGFPLPFFFMGSMTLLSIIPILLTLPEKCTLVAGKKSEGALSALSNYRFFLDVAVNVVCCILFGYNDATLEHHLRSFTNLNAAQTGAIFLICGLFYAVSTQVWGQLCDKIRNCQLVCIFSFVLSIISLSLCGPISGIPLEPNVTFVCIAQVLFGIAMGGQVVGSFTDGLRTMERTNRSKGIGLYALISSMFASAFSFGASIGPTLGGVLVEHLGYRKSVVYIVLIQIALVIAMTIHNLKRCRREGPKRKSEGMAS